MASVQCQFASYVHGGASSMDSKLHLAQIGQRTQVMRHTGLRRTEVLQMRSNVKVSSVKRWKSVGTKIICGSGMSLVFVSAECGPWSKTGGLGDVVGGLPPALAANGHRVMTVSPRYDQYKDAWDTSVIVEVTYLLSFYPTFLPCRFFTFFNFY